jgi:imidazolonepropionase-like amidohydrolase
MSTPAIGHSTPALSCRVMKAFTLFICVAVAGCTSLDPATSSSKRERWVLTGTKVYVAPDTPPLDDAWVLINGRSIEAVGAASTMPPTGVRIDSACSGGTIIAGFQNSHVHFTDPAFAEAAARPAADLEQALSRMLTSRGFTTVVDTGSLVDNTVTLRERIERDEIKGPAILTAGIPLYPENGIPIYLRDLPPSLLSQLPQPATPAEAVEVVRRNFARGANGTKLFVATPVGRGEIMRMSPDIARMAAAETHARSGMVMSHPTDADGVAAAVAAGADIIVHTTIDGRKDGGVWSADLIRDMRARNVSVVPTLKLWHYELDKGKVPANVQQDIVAGAQKQLKAFADAGGQVLFGTDVGYMSDFDPTDEYTLMAAAGLTPMQILASLTTAPAARWKDEERRGRVRRGLDADLVVLNGDPGTNVSHFADVRCTIRSGKPVFVGATRD